MRRSERFDVSLVGVLLRDGEIIDSALVTQLGLNSLCGSSSSSLNWGENCWFKGYLCEGGPCLTLPMVVWVTKGLQFTAQLKCPRAHSMHWLSEWVRERRCERRVAPPVAIGW